MHHRIQRAEIRCVSAIIRPAKYKVQVQGTKVHGLTFGVDCGSNPVASTSVQRYGHDRAARDQQLCTCPGVGGASDGSTTNARGGVAAAQVVS